MLKKVSYYLISIVKLLNGFCETPTVIRLFLFPNLRRRFLVTLRKSDLRFYVRSAMDVWSIKETFLDNFYLPKGMFNIEKDWNIIDIGAGVGDFSLLAGSLVPVGKVFAFEAFSETFHLLQENINLNRFSNIKAYFEAVGAKDGHLFIDQNSAEPLQYSTRDYGTHHKDLPVKAVSLERIFEREEIPFCHLLKLDCEGGEYEILFSLTPKILQRIGAVTMEYHDGVTAYSHQDLVEYFHQHGFEVQVQPNLVHSYLGYLFAKRIKEK